MGKKKSKSRDKSYNKNKPTPKSIAKQSNIDNENKLSVNEYKEKQERLTKETTIKLKNQRGRFFEYVKTGLFYFVAGLILLGFAGALFLTIYFIVLVFSGNERANKLFSFIQFMTSIASLGIGIWGIIIALGAKGTSNQFSSTLGVRQTPVEPDVKGVLGEEDINKESI